MTREYEFLTESEVKLFLDSIRQSKSKYWIRNYVLFYLMFLHGLRVSEAISLEFKNVDLKEGVIRFGRLKNSKKGIHPMQSGEIIWIKKLKKFYQDNKMSTNRWLFQSQMGGALTRTTINDLCNKYNPLDKHIHPHMFKHSCATYLVNKNTPITLIQEWLGHKNIQNTMVYSHLDTSKFVELFKEF